MLRMPYVAWCVRTVCKEVDDTRINTVHVLFNFKSSVAGVVRHHLSVCMCLGCQNKTSQTFHMLNTFFRRKWQPFTRMHSCEFSLRPTGFYVAISQLPMFMLPFYEWHINWTIKNVWIHTRLVCACEFLLNLSHTFSHLVLAIIFISIKLRTMHFASFGKSNHKLKRMAHQESAIDRNRRIIRSISITTVMLARILVIRNVG